jgi:phosphatidylglycerol:prolipoprotein diacylglycerol transferase
MLSAVLAIKIGLDPTLFEVAGVEVTWHGLFTAIGVVAGVTTAAILGRRSGFREDTIYNFALALVVGGIVGARALYVIENWSLFEDDYGDIFAINTGGISIYGALIGGMVGAWLYAIVSKLPDIPGAADIAAIGGIMGMAVGRIGDVINGEHFAKSSDLPWAVRYTHIDSPSYLYFGGPNVSQHPAVGYELLGDLLIFGLLLLLYLRVQRHGVVFFAWMFLYGALRLAVSFLRLDDIVWMGLRTAQLIAIASMAVALPAIIYMLRTPPREARMSRADRRRLMREEGAEGEPSPGS